MLSDIYQKTKQAWQEIRHKKTDPVAVFVRHCHFSEASAHKKRMPYFSKYKCFLNLMHTLEEEKTVEVTFLLDTFFPMEEEHFITKQTKYPVIRIKEGNEAGSFLRLLEVAQERVKDPDTILYFLEDDYIHRPGWISILREGIALDKSDYVTLYDHKDKYFYPQYQDLRSQLFQSPSSHWRTTPSTTNTYAMRKKTFMNHLDIHETYSQNRKITADHDKFCALSEKGALLISSIPGWATHAEDEFLSPCVDWEKVLTFSLNHSQK